MIGIGLNINNRVIVSGGYDPDAQAFFDRVTTAGGTLTTTEKNATNQLVLDMKSAGIWTSMKAVYPMVGASAAACAQNLKSASFTGSFSSGWTFASSGINGNGTSTYMNTFLNPSSVLSSSANFFAYVNNNGTNLINTRDLDLTDGSSFENGLVITFTNQTYSLQGTYSPLQYIQTPFNTSILGLFQANYISGTNYVIRNNSILTSAVQGQSYYNFPLYLGAANNTNDGSPFTPTDRRYALAGVSDGLTTAQASNLYTAVQTFNTTLSRSVGTPIVSDADAQAYINRVYTAGGTLTNTEANAVNQLVIDMKAAGIWTAMKAVYPMVGASAAACAQNLKSSSFTGTFTSGWTFASTGATPNGTSAYMDTAFNPNLFTANSYHLSYYSRTNNTSSIIREIGVNNLASAAYNPEFSIAIRDGVFPGGATFLGDYNIVCTGNTSNSDYFAIGSRTSATSIKLYKNNTVLGASTNINSLTSCALNIYIGCVNFGGTAGRFSNRQCAFSSIGDGLTDTQASNFYTAVQAFQTTLSRQV